MNISKLIKINLPNNKIVYLYDYTMGTKVTQINSRGQGGQPTQVIQLLAKFHDGSGNLIDLDSFPTVALIQTNGAVYLQPTSAGVFHLSTGVYGYDFDIPYTVDLGTWSDRWVGQLNGFAMQAEFNFVISTTQQPTLPTDGYNYLGQDPGFNFSQTAIQNINILLKGVKNRLKSSGKAAGKDNFGNQIFQDCDIFSVDQLVTFLATALSAFNMIPTFTEFTFEDSEIIRVFYAVIIQHAVLSAMAAQSLVEAGREFSITDNGVNWVPPGVSEKLAAQYTAEMGNWNDSVAKIKGSMKPISRGISSYASLGSPRLRILRTVRSRQIF